MNLKLRREPLGRLSGKIWDVVPPKHQNVSERLYEAHRAKIASICGERGVLLDDGWNFVDDKFLDELARVK